MTDSKPESLNEDVNGNESSSEVRRATKEKMKEDRDNSTSRKRVKYNSKSESEDGKTKYVWFFLFPLWGPFIYFIRQLFLSVFDPFPP